MRLRGGLLARLLLLAGGLALDAEQAGRCAGRRTSRPRLPALPAVRSAESLTLQDASQQPGYAEQSNAERPGPARQTTRRTGAGRQGVTGTVNMPQAPNTAR